MTLLEQLQNASKKSKQEVVTKYFKKIDEYLLRMANQGETSCDMFFHNLDIYANLRLEPADCDPDIISSSLIMEDVIDLPSAVDAIISHYRKQGVDCRSLLVHNCVRFTWATSL
ncbi:MAG: hypothetical protein K6G62_00730 [Eubacterium sp.]|nr:hypothetical protein [Eubacterium sp.]